MNFGIMNAVILRAFYDVTNQNWLLLIPILMTFLFPFGAGSALSFSCHNTSSDKIQFCPNPVEEGKKQKILIMYASVSFCSYFNEGKTEPGCVFLFFVNDALQSSHSAVWLIPVKLFHSYLQSQSHSPPGGKHGEYISCTMVKHPLRSGLTSSNSPAKLF